MMQDVQSRADSRGIAIQRVGVKRVKLPFLIKTKQGGEQQVLACIQFTVSLPREFKGTHMSRFLEILLPWSAKPLAEEEMEAMLEEALTLLHAEAAEVSISFTYFIEKAAPVSGRVSLLDVEASFTGRKRRGTPMQFELGLAMPFTSLCPCSKEISRYGAHNQRSVARVILRYHEGCPAIYIEDLAVLLERQGSAPIYPLLKRADEKHVTEEAYEHPKFVEDILRDIVLALRELPGLSYFSLECENEESIHHHNAFAAHEEFLAK